MILSGDGLGLSSLHSQGIGEHHLCLAHSLVVEFGGFARQMIRPVADDVGVPVVFPFSGERVDMALVEMDVDGDDLDSPFVQPVLERKEVLRGGVLANGADSFADWRPSWDDLLSALDDPDAILFLRCLADIVAVPLAHLVKDRIEGPPGIVGMDPVTVTLGPVVEDIVLLLSGHLNALEIFRITLVMESCTLGVASLEMYSRLHLS